MTYSTHTEQRVSVASPIVIANCELVYSRIQVFEPHLSSGHSIAVALVRGLFT
ncbi:hypothetical protein [Nostoc sp.]|uniref:hypothetical protein n=1 Tax=Nostoc sp. TaxID=1180 RepID=UPI002FFB343D